MLKQGAHIDPADPSTPAPNPDDWSERQRRAVSSPAMEEYRAGLRLDGNGDIRSAVLDDLSTHYGFSKDECVRRCLHWEEWSVEEWRRRPRESRSDPFEFYHSTQSWSFDLLWYAYLQAEGYAYPVSVAITESLPTPLGPAKPRHLDFGSGVGATSQLFRRLGYESDLADISTTLLAFARFRLERRNESARYIDLNSESIPIAQYDVITAIDSLAHVPDLPEVATQLHAALKPGGVLFANFDVRPKSPENAWHLYSNDLPLRWQLHRTGFEPEVSLDGMSTLYRRIEPSGLRYAACGARDLVLLRSPLRPLYRLAKAALHEVKESGPLVALDRLATNVRSRRA